MPTFIGFGHISRSFGAPTVSGLPAEAAPCRGLAEGATQGDRHERREEPEREMHMSSSRARTRLPIRPHLTALGEEPHCPVTSQSPANDHVRFGEHFRPKPQYRVALEPAASPIFRSVSLTCLRGCYPVTDLCIFPSLCKQMSLVLHRFCPSTCPALHQSA